MFEPKKAEVAGGWRTPYNEELHSLYTSPNRIRITKSRKMRWASHFRINGEKRNA
jgi:hypothetical protein